MPSSVTERHRSSKGSSGYRVADQLGRDATRRDESLPRSGDQDGRFAGSRAIDFGDGSACGRGRSIRRSELSSSLLIGTGELVAITAGIGSFVAFQPPPPVWS